MIERVHYLESIFTNELIVSVHEHLHIVSPAEVEGRVYDVISGVVPLQVLHKSDPVHREVDGLQVVDGTVHVVVGGRVVDENNVVVLVFLLDYRPHDLDVSVVLDVVMTEYSNAEAHLLANRLVVVDLILLAILLVLKLLDGMVFR